MTRKGLQGRSIPIGDLAPDLVSRWRDLQRAESHLSTPFFSYEFAAHTAAVRGNAFVCVISDASDPIGFLPFQYASRVHRGLRAAERIGGELNDYFGLVAAPNLHLSPAELLRLAGLNHLYFTHLQSEQLRHGLDGEDPEVGLLIDLDPSQSFWERLRSRDKKFVQDTERRQRKLEAAHGPLRFHLHAPDSGLELDRIIDRKREQYGTTGVPDCLQESWCRDLLRSVTASESTACCGVVSTLYAGDTWVASQLSLRGHHVLHNWFPAYNRDLAEFSPGRLLLKHVADSAPAAGISVIDRGVGDTQAKRDFATREQQLYRGVWYQPGVSSTVYRAYCSMVWRMAKSRPRHQSGAAVLEAHQHA